jgi:hypothetical protein
MITKYHNGMTAFDLFQIVLFIIIPHYSRHFYKFKKRRVGKTLLILFQGYHLSFGSILI